MDSRLHCIDMYLYQSHSCYCKCPYFDDISCANSR